MTRGAPGTPGRSVEYFDKLFANTVTAAAAIAYPLSAESYEIFQVLVRANPDNTGRVLVGDQWTYSIPLDPGDSITIPIDDLRKVYVSFDTIADTVGWLAMG